MKIQKGKGWYIWIVKDMLERFYNGSMVAMVEDAQRNGITHVQIKIVDGTYGFNTNVDLKSLVMMFQGAGIQVDGWGFHYPTYLNSQVSKIIQRVTELGVDTYGLNCEGHWTNKWAEASSFATRVTNACPVDVWLTSYRFPVTLHRDFPFYQFMSYVKWVMPQVYWWGATNSAEQLARSVAEHRSIRDIPIVPVGFAFGESGYRPAESEIIKYNAMALELGLSGTSFWEMRNSKLKYATDTGKLLFDVVSDLEGWESDSPPDPPDPPTPPDPELTYNEKTDILWKEAENHFWDLSPD